MIQDYCYCVERIATQHFTLIYLHMLCACVHVCLCSLFDPANFRYFIVFHLFENLAAFHIGRMMAVVWFLLPTQRTHFIAIIPCIRAFFCANKLLRWFNFTGSLATFSIALLPVICATLVFVVVYSSVCFLLLLFLKHLISLNSISSAHAFTFHCKNSFVRTSAIAILLPNTLYVICNYKSILSIFTLLIFLSNRNAI